MAFTIRLIQNSFTDGAFLVSLPSNVASITCHKYDIRVVENEEVANIGQDAIATSTVINNFTITSTPSSFAIPMNAAMIDGKKYKATIRLYSSSFTVPYSYTTSELYYDTRVYTIAPVSVTSIPASGTDSSMFNIANVQVLRDSDTMPLSDSDPFFSAVGVSEHGRVVMSCTSLVKNASDTFNTGTEYYLGSKPFVFDASYNFDITDDMEAVAVTTASAYELWGYLSLSSQFTFGINIVAKGGQPGDVNNDTDNDTTNDTTVGYVINNPEITLKLGDVIGAVSPNPIEITLNNWSHYNNSTYKFDKLTLEIYDENGSNVLTGNLGKQLVYTKQYSDFVSIGNKMVVQFSSDDLNKTNEVENEVTNEHPLTNGVTYKFKTILNFTNDLLYKPHLVRSATHTGQFTELIFPIDTGSAVNSWQIDPTKGDGLIVSFKKTDQFYGSPSTKAYNLEGNTTVTAEYRTFDTPTGWSDWSLLSGGSISQPILPSDIDYAGNNNNITGVYSVPVYSNANAVETIGSEQPLVRIYAKIPGQANYSAVKIRQAKYSAVQIRLRLITTNPVFSSKISTLYEVPRVTGTTYKNNQVVDDTVTFRYHPKPVAHDFTTDKPICTSAGANISFDVPLTVYPFFTAKVTTSAGGSLANITNANTYDVDNLTSWNKEVARTGSGLSYTPQANASFTLSVKYESSENPNIFVETPMTVQRQGFPSNSYSITSCRWDSVNQEVDYVLAISATSTSADRMDGWNVYTSAPNASGNLIKDASGNEVSLQQIKLNSDGVTQSVTLTGVSYLDYKTITVTFVATRSLYLNPANVTNQVETIGAGVRDTKQAQVTKLPAVLPQINSVDITLENMVYNVITGGSRQATLSAIHRSPANGLQITDKSDTSPDGLINNDTSRNIQLTNSVVERKYEIRAKYESLNYSVNPTNKYVYSLPVTVTFKTGISNRDTPSIKSKSYSNNKFTVTYTSANAGSTSWASSNTALTSSDVWVKKTGSSDTHVGSNNGSVDISVFNGDNVSMYVQDKFTTTYTVTPTVVNGTITNDNGINRTSVVQTVNSPYPSFYLAANPQIVENSIVVNGTNNTITVNVNNMGTPVLNNALLVVSQDSTTNENDKGYYGVAYFESSVGFSTYEWNKLTITGDTATQALQTPLTVTDNGVTGMSKVTTLKFSSVNLANTNPVNVSLFVGNTVEGSDSCAVADKAVIYPPMLELDVNGVTVKYNGDATATMPVFVYENPRGTGSEWFAVVNDSSKSMITNYAKNLSSGSGRNYFTRSGIVVPFNNIVTTLVTDMYSLVSYSSFNESISSWDTSNVVNMLEMFVASAFNQDISYWNTSRVTNMATMFRGTPFNYNIGSWNTSMVTSMNNMFHSASAFNQNIGSWNTSKVTNMNSMFDSASTFNRSISEWNTANVTTMIQMFNNATAFDKPLNLWNTSKVNNMYAMFAGTSKFNQPLNSWNTANVVYMNRMFSSATAFNQNISSWNVTKVTNHDDFNDNNSPLTVENSPSWNKLTLNANGVTIKYVGAALTTIPLFINENPRGTGFEWFAVVNDTSKGMITDYIKNVSSGSGRTYFTTSGNVVPFNNIVTTLVTDMSNLCGSAWTTFNEPIGAWDTSNVTSMLQLFCLANTFNRPIDKWNTSNVVDMYSMFTNAHNFNQPIGSWNTSKVTRMTQVFNDCSNFNQSIESWNTANVTSMDHMFAGTILFDKPLNSWNIAKVTSMNAMFYGSLFNQPLNLWNTANVTSMDYIFKNSYFNQNINSWNVVKVTSKPPPDFSVNSPLTVENSPVWT